MSVCGLFCCTFFGWSIPPPLWVALARSPCVLQPSRVHLSCALPVLATCRICVTKTLPIYGLPLANPFIYRPSRMAVVIHGGFKPSHVVLFMSFLWDLCPFSEGFPLLWTPLYIWHHLAAYLHILTAFNRLLILSCSASALLMPDFAPKIGVFR